MLNKVSKLFLLQQVKQVFATRRGVKRFIHQGHTVGIEQATCNHCRKVFRSLFYACKLNVTRYWRNMLSCN
ncbi:hypothetical protein SAMN05216353_10597 [Halobacillus alkaliphilus]|uniref:Uncharacterized protein n=1 Tax=Halobacillus alkaliphilus TaxID=396056 RepID=A0A1I2KP16_9BACI|nr:hypothetical protein SAMN05216353_10597 [Halobacillus alkaliphilus]